MPQPAGPGKHTVREIHTPPPVDNVALREQAAEYLGFKPYVDLDIGDGEVFTLYYRDLLPPDQYLAMQEHERFMREDLDTETVPDDIVDGRTLTRPKSPPRVNGELIYPEAHQAKLIMSCDPRPNVYERFIAAGGVPGQIQMFWTECVLRMKDRAVKDSKSL